MGLANSTEQWDDYVYLNASHTSKPEPIAAAAFAAISIIGVIANTVLLLYIVAHKLYHNFISSHFIAHLCITNLFALCVLVPILCYTAWTGENLWQNSHVLCRIQALLTCCVWTVLALMVLCIAGVHLLTFARIHYEQLFGLPPNMLCALSWLISFALALPSLTNGHIVVYDPALRQCVWGHSDSGLKFLTYLLILGVFIPAAFSSYAYIRVLGILYHSPIVFQSIGLYKSRWLVYAFLISPLYQVPFYAVNLWGNPHGDTLIPLVTMFAAFTQCIVSPALYGASLFMIKEEDMALTARAHKGGVPGPGYAHPSHHHPGTGAGGHPHSLQAQLI